MSLWRQLTHGIRGLTNRSAADRDLADELAHYIEEATAEFIERGFSPEEARRAARMQAGSLMAVRDQVLAAGWEHFVETFFADVRYGARRLWSAPAFALASVVTLALGIGASTAIFSAVTPILFESLPYPNAERVMAIWDYAADDSRLEVTFGTYREILERSRSFEALAVFRRWQATSRGPAEPERLEGQRVSGDYFEVLGVGPALGRAFEAEDDRLNAPNVAILGDALWRRRFGGDPAIIGRPIGLDEASFTVIGVMPRGFKNVMQPSAEIWSPLRYDPSLPVNGREWGHHLQMAGRLRAGITSALARDELNAIARTPLSSFPRVPWASLGSGLIVTPLQEDVTRAVRPALVAVLGAVMLVLVMACVNVTNLTMAQGMRRREEFAMRAALGAGRIRLVRQVVTEGLLLAALGGTLGSVLAVFALNALVAISPDALPRRDTIDLDVPALMFAAAVTTVIGLIVGLVTVRYAASDRLQGGLRSGARTTAGGHHTASRALVVAEVALALVLLVSAGLLVRTLQNLFAISPGFNPSHVLTLQVQVSGRRFDHATTTRFFEAALDAVRRVPGVSAAAFSSQLPLSGDRSEFGVSFDTNANEPSKTGFPAFRYAVSDGYFDALQLPLRRGRVLARHDAAGSPRVAVVSESFAKRFPGSEPIGQRIRVGPADLPPYTVVGVVGDVRQTSLAAPETDAVYVTPAQWHFTETALWLVVRSMGGAASMTATVRSAIWSVDRDQPIVRVATMEDLLAASAGERRFALMLFEVFGMVALLLAATGLYGVMANGVNERTKEIGVRLALGASPGGILRFIVGQALTVTCVGLAIGLVGAVFATRGMITLLFGVSQLDPLTYVIGVFLLLGVALIAGGIPAWHASRVDAAVTLRSE